MKNITKTQFVSGAMWKIIEQFLTKGISLLISIVLARILLPEDYGLITLTAVFTNLSDILIDGGFSSALIRKKDVDEYDYGCTFSISSSIALILYVILFFSAPFISEYYNEPDLTSVLRVVGLTFFIQAFASNRNAVINRNMQFKLLFYCNAISCVVSGICGIIAAYCGLGVWALVIQRLMLQALLTVLLYLKVHFKVRWKFDKERFKEIFRFSIGVVGSSVLNYIGGNVYSAVIGKIHSATDLAYYDKGGQLPMQMSLYTFGAMSTVLLPTLSSYQTELEKVKAIIRKVTAMTSYLILPMMVGMAFVSKELIVLLLTEKWLPSVRIMQYNCLYYLATPFMLINVQVFFALGKSQLRVKTEIIRLVLNVVSLVVFGMWIKCPLNELALVSAAVAVISAAVTSFETKKLIDYRFGEVIADMSKPLLASAVMAVALYLVSMFCLAGTGIFISLCVKVIVGALIYWILSLVLRMNEYREIIGLLKGFIVRDGTKE